MMQSSNEKSRNLISQEQVTQIIDAILRGKYSWACVLMLKYLGYDPMHYLPDRTLSRLVKENGLPGQPCLRSKVNSPFSEGKREGSSDDYSHTPRGRLRDLPHLEAIGGKSRFLSGGHHALWFDAELDYVQDASMF